MEYYEGQLRYLLKDKSYDSEQIEKCLSLLDGYKDDMEEESGDFTHVEGTGLYAIHSKLNHAW